MSNPHIPSVLPQQTGATKILIAEFPGKSALYISDEKAIPMEFTDSTAALTWCETNHVIFWYLPAIPPNQN